MKRIVSLQSWATLPLLPVEVAPPSSLRLLRSKPSVDSLFDIKLTPELDVCRATEIHSFYYAAIEEELDKKDSWGRLASDPSSLVRYRGW